MQICLPTMLAVLCISQDSSLLSENQTRCKLVPHRSICCACRSFGNVKILRPPSAFYESACQTQPAYVKDDEIKDMLESEPDACSIHSRPAPCFKKIYDEEANSIPLTSDSNLTAFRNLEASCCLLVRAKGLEWFSEVTRDSNRLLWNRSLRSEIHPGVSEDLSWYPEAALRSWNLGLCRHKP